MHGQIATEEACAAHFLPKQKHTKVAKVFKKEAPLSSQYDGQGHQGIREIIEKSLSPALLKENRHTESPKSAVKQEERQRQAEQLQHYHQMRQILEDQRRQIERAH